MTYNNQYVRAWFHLYSGGHTASKEGRISKTVSYIRVKQFNLCSADVKEVACGFPLTQVKKTLAK